MPDDTPPPTYPTHAGDHRPSRRTVLVAAGGVGVSGALAAVLGSVQTADAATGASCGTVSPTVTEGPYWVDTQLRRSDIRSNADGSSTQAGVPLTLTVTLFGNSSCTTPLAGAHVVIWHANAAGHYSDFAAEGTAGQTWLRGYQVSDARGQVTFTTNHPGWYTGRAIHVHVRVRTYDGTSAVTDFTSQFFFTEAVNTAVLKNGDYKADSSQRTLNAQDGIYNQEVSGGGALLVASAGDATNGYTGSATLILATTGTSTPTSSTSTSSTPTSTATVTPTSSTTSSPANTVQAWLTGITTKARGSLRTLSVGVRAEEAVLMRVYLWNTRTRSWQWAAGRRLGTGSTTQTVTIPSWVASGTAGVVVKLTDTAGASRWYRSDVHIA